MDIISNGTILVLALGIFLMALIVVQMFLASRHDYVISAQEPIATLEALEKQIEALEKQIESKQNILLDYDKDLEERRQALADFADKVADVDALKRKLDELTAEWNMMAEKREEVRNMRLETEEAWIEKQRVDGDLRQAEEQLDGVKAQIERAENLDVRIEALQRREEELRTLIGSLEGVAHELQHANEQLRYLEDRSHQLKREIADLEGRREATDGQLQDFSARLIAERTTVAQISGEVTDLRAQRASMQETLSTLQKEKEDLAQQVQRLQQEENDLDDVSKRLGEARVELEKAHQARNEAQSQLGVVRTLLSEYREELSGIEGRIAAATEILDEQRRKMDGLGGGSVEDRLKELNTRPAVLLNLEKWPIWVPRSGELQPEAEAIERVSDRFEAVGLRYHPRILRAFHTSLKVNETTQMTVLSGISGTGKSQLPRQYAAGMGIGFLQVPVQPRWDSPQDLMGFFNYIESRFRPTDLARALWQLDPLNNDDAMGDRMMLVLLDEMNLARVEYYFSDFLSRLENRPSPDCVDDRNLRKDAEIELEIPMPQGTSAKRVFPGYNLLFAGTMNEDESTQSLSDKVVDRANIMRFGAPRQIESTNPREQLPEPEALSRKMWNDWGKPVSSIEDEKQVWDDLERMREVMVGFKKPFGHRLGRAILAYVANYPELDGVVPLHHALADQVEMRLLPKLRGIELDHGDIDARFGDLINFVNYLDDSPLAEAIADSVETSRDGSGQFVWTGVNRM